MAPRALRTVSRYSLMAGVLLLLTGALLYPIFLTVKGAFAVDPASGEGFTLDHFALVLKDPRTLGGLAAALQIAVLTTVLSVAIALPLAFASARYRFPGKAVWNAAILVPLILPPFGPSRSSVKTALARSS